METPQPTDNVIRLSWFAGQGMTIDQFVVLQHEFALDIHRKILQFIGLDNDQVETLVDAASEDHVLDFLDKIMQASMELNHADDDPHLAH